MVAYWLMKSEPGAWSWEDQVKAGPAEWDGVRNYQASNNMKAMKIGDKAFFYHSVKAKEIVGVVRVVKEYYPDHTDASGRFRHGRRRGRSNLSKRLSHWPISRRHPSSPISNSCVIRACP